MAEESKRDMEQKQTQMRAIREETRQRLAVASFVQNDDFLTSSSRFIPSLQSLLI